MTHKLIYLARRNPTVTAEDWPRTWRSHAKFASQFGAITGPIVYVCYTDRLRAPALDGAPFEPPGVSRDYDGVALAAATQPFNTTTEIPADVRAKVEQDELRVFDRCTHHFSFYCREAFIHGGTAGQVAVIRFLARKSGTSPHDFLAHWSGNHAKLAARVANAARTVTRYVHNDLAAPPPSDYPIDGISETWFGNANDAVRAFADDKFTLLVQDLADFCDMERSITMLTSVIYRWPRT